MPLTSSQKGAIAEAEIAAALIQLGLVVLRPLCEGRRYDLVIDADQTMLRVQCKWASRRGDIVTTRCSTSRHTPTGYRKTTYSAKEIDAVAAYAPDIDRCFLLQLRRSRVTRRSRCALPRRATSRPSASAGHETTS